MHSEIEEVLQEILAALLADFDKRVPAEGSFDDFRIKKQVYFGDPATAMPGLLELTIMSMEEKLDASHRAMRFLAVRVKKSSRGGTVSATCFHGTTDELRAELEREKRDPTLLMEKISELALGLPEETNSDLWR